MKIFILLIFLKLINISFLSIPLWDLKSSSISLVSTLSPSINITIYNESSNNMKVTLIKNIKKESDHIIIKNYISVLGKEFIETIWEDIDSIYYINNKYYICPKGKNFLNEYINNRFEEIRPVSNYDNEHNNWDLKCFFQSERNWFFQIFLNSIDKHYYGYYFNKPYSWHYIIYNKNNQQEERKSLLDFLWTIKSIKKYDAYSNNMVALIIVNSNIYLYNFNTVMSEDTSYNENSYNQLISEKFEYTNAYFNNNTKKFYWMTYNSIKDYKGGYSTDTIDVDNPKSNINIINYTTSPFDGIFNNAKINKMEMIRDSKYAYYEIQDNENSNNIYRGIVDIELNKVIFNTNENIKTFQPLGNYSMLVITDDNSAYQLCAIKANNKCIESCPVNTKLIIDNENGNYCKCDGYIHIPDYICDKSCDVSIYGLNENKECGFCKYLYTDKPYKIIYEEGCLKEKPPNTFYVNETINLLQYCNSPCFECTSLDNCKSCENGYYLKDNNNCVNCHQNCETCSKGQEKDENDTINENCESCPSGRYLINSKDHYSNCVDKCPTGTIIKDNECIDESSKEKEEDKEDKKDKEETDNKGNDEDNNDSIDSRDSLLLWIFIGGTGLLLIIFSLCVYKKAFCYKNDDMEKTDIMCELEEKRE